MSKPALQLDSYFFKRIMVESRLGNGPEHAKDYESKLVVSALTGQAEKSAGEWMVGLRIQSPKDLPKWFPFKIDVEAIGFVKVPDDIDQRLWEEVVVKNGAALLYGAMRELIASVTGRHPLPTYFLPTATFDGLTKAEPQSRKVKTKETKKRLTQSG